jgi:hypothetical protein
MYFFRSVFLFNKDLIEFLDEIIFQIEDFPTCLMEALTLFKEVGQLGFVTFFGRLIPVINPSNSSQEQLIKLFHSCGDF